MGTCVASTRQDGSSTGGHVATASSGWRDEGTTVGAVLCDGSLASVRGHHVGTPIPMDGWPHGLACGDATVGLWDREALTLVEPHGRTHRVERMTTSPMHVVAQPTGLVWASGRVVRSYTERESPPTA